MGRTGEEVLKLRSDPSESIRDDVSIAKVGRDSKKIKTNNAINGRERESTMRTE